MGSYEHRAGRCIRANNLILHSEFFFSFFFTESQIRSGLLKKKKKALSSHQRIVTFHLCVSSELRAAFLKHTPEL